jgi:divalent metal cation (Fe/Co/Zn/Cd) transporter
MVPRRGGGRKAFLQKRPRRQHLERATSRLGSPRWKPRPPPWLGYTDAVCGLSGSPAYIGFEATRALGWGEEPDTSSVGVILAIASLVVMPTLAYAKQRTGRALGSRALEADAIETWVCAYLSLALLVGVGLHATLGWWWADPAGALAMLPVIVWQGWETLEEARDADD